MLEAEHPASDEPTILLVARFHGYHGSQSPNRMRVTRSPSAMGKQSHPWHPLDLADAREAWRGYAVYAQHTMGRRDGHCEVVARLQSQLANATVGSAD